ncbi:MAG: hypothetical protein K0R18_513 [Bacillales bacterium]|nr:hypothetical protein [Bacillales bacterium]
MYNITLGGATMNIDIYCKDSLCPICNSKMDISPFVVFKKTCLNGCYKIDEYEQLDWTDKYYVYFFGKLFIGFNSRDIDKILKEQEVIDQIVYWKENDKYLAELIRR